MRPIADLLDFLTHQMSMQAVYQPVVILHLLTRGGLATRADLARRWLRQGGVMTNQRL